MPLQLACDWLRSERVLRPPVDTLSRRVAAARDSARAETYHRLAPLLEPPRPTALDGLLDVDDELGMTRLAWMRRRATAATPEVLKAELAKLEFLCGYGADRLDLFGLLAGRRRVLAETGRRSTNQALQRADADRRHPSCSPHSPRPTSKSWTSWCNYSIKRWPARTRGRVTSCPSGSWTVRAPRSSVAGCSTTRLTCSLTQRFPTSRSGS